MRTCPYCSGPATPQSKDHVFPEFLGGTRRIIACKSCNDTFGHSFEAAAANLLQPLHVFISSWGLPLRPSDAVWPSAAIRDGQLLNLRVGGRGALVDLARPMLETDADGNVVRGVFPARLRRHAEAMAESVASKLGGTYRITESSPPTELAGLSLTMEVGADLRLLALKLSVAAASLLRDFATEEVAPTISSLFGSPDLNLLPRIVYDVPKGLDDLAPGLAHVVYAERKDGVLMGLVRFYGMYEFAIRLGETSRPEAAILGILDPVTGNESFSAVEPLGVIEPPFSAPLARFQVLVEAWFQRLRDGAVRRGATHPPDLHFEVRVQVEPGA